MQVIDKGRAKKAKISIESWEAWDGFMFDLVTRSGDTMKDDTYEAWVYHKDYGVKMLMWGVPQDSTDYWGFKDMVASTLEENIEGYREEYMD